MARAAGTTIMTKRSRIMPKVSSSTTEPHSSRSVSGRITGESMVSNRIMDRHSSTLPPPMTIHIREDTAAGGTLHQHQTQGVEGLVREAHAANTQSGQRHEKVERKHGDEHRLGVGEDPAQILHTAAQTVGKGLEHHQGGNGGTQQTDLIGEQQSQCQSAEDQQGHFRGHPGVECLEFIHGRIQGPF